MLPDSQTLKDPKDLFINTVVFPEVIKILDAMNIHFAGPFELPLVSTSKTRTGRTRGLMWRLLLILKIHPHVTVSQGS